MKLYLGLFYLGWFGYTMSQIVGTTNEPGNVTDVKHEADNSFDLNFAKNILLKSSKNTILSPLSLKILLSILLEGTEAGSESALELQSIFKDNRSGINLRMHYRNLLDSYKVAENDDYDFRLGSKMYHSPRIDPAPSLVSLMKEYYDAESESTDFQDLPRSSKIINGWCSNVTNGHIDDLISDEMLMDPDLVMILMNAVFFNGKWKIPFKKELTRSKEFYKAPNNTINVSFMQHSNRLDMADLDGLNTKMLRLPYLGDRFSMIFLIPNERDGLNELIRGIDDMKLKTGRLNLKKTYPQILYLPKFKFTYDAKSDDIKSSLIDIGIEQIYSSRSAKLTKFGGVTVSKIIQKAGIEVDEEGSTLYAATAILLVSRCCGAPSFFVDRPFLFYLLDELTGTIMFIGKVVDPSAVS